MQKLIAILFLWAASAIAGDLQIAWNANPPADQVTAYRLYVAPGLTNAFTLYASTTNTTITATNLNPGTYRFRLTAVNLWQVESQPSQVIQTPSGAPSTPVLLFFRIVNPP